MAITSRALAFVSRWFDPATVARVFEPLIADWQREWIDAPKAERLIVHSRGMLSFFIAAMVSTPGVWRARAPQSLTDQIARRIVIYVGVVTAVLLLPLVQEMPEPWLRGWLIIFAIPGAMTLAFPFAMVPAVDAIRNFTGAAPHLARAAVAKLGAFAVVFIIVANGWIVPLANQAWRTATTQNRASAPVPPMRELTTFELLATGTATFHERGTSAFARAQIIQREINQRAAMAVLPILLLWRRWRALDLPAGHWFSPRHTVTATIVMIVSFSMLRSYHRIVEQTWQLPAGSGPWLTLLLLALAGTLRVQITELRVSRG